MKIIKTERRLCTCCMEEHEVKMVRIRERNIFKGVPVEYDAEYFYCDRADETYADEQQISQNDISTEAGIFTLPAEHYTAQWQKP